MAEEHGPGGKPRQKRSMKPKPSTIDLEATEIEREAAPEADPPREEAAADDSGLLESEPRSLLGALIAAGVAGAAISLVLFVLLLATGLLPIGGANDAALGSRVADIELQLTELDRQPPAAGLSDNGALRAEIQALSKQVQELRTAPSGPGADAALGTRVDELAARVDQITDSRAAAFDQLAARVTELAARTAEERAPDPAVQEALTGAKSAATLAAVASLDSAVARGAPYASALGAVKRQLPDASYAALEEGAERGLPSPALLADRLAAKLEKAPAPPSQATGFVDRLTDGARSLVRVKPVDGSVPQISEGDPWSARNAVAIRLQQGDYAGALADWEKLDTIAKDGTKVEAEALKKRLEANTALDALRGAALGAEKTP
jgi:hypothetical protein